MILNAAKTDLSCARLCILASGSSGNALFVDAGGTRLLIDAGLPGAELLGRLTAIGERIEDIDAVLVTHEHGDHSRGLPDLAAMRLRMQILATEGTVRAAGPRIAPCFSPGRMRSGDPLMIGGLRILPFGVSHDAAEPIGFRLGAGDWTAGIATDLGEASPEVRRALAGCRAIVIESNHDPELLRTGHYPPYLKRRVASRAGHLSNRQMQSLLGDVAGPRLEHVILVHLSRKNNSPERAEAAAREALRGVSETALISIGDPFRVGEVLRFDVRLGAMAILPGSLNNAVVPAARQLDLFDRSI